MLLRSIQWVIQLKKKRTLRITLQLCLQQFALTWTEFETKAWKNSLLCILKFIQVLSITTNTLRSGVWDTSTQVALSHMKGSVPPIAGLDFMPVTKYPWITQVCLCLLCTQKKKKSPLTPNFSESQVSPWNPFLIWNHLQLGCKKSL